MDRLYDSRGLLLKGIRNLSAGDQQIVLERMKYVGDSLSHQAMAMLYQVADAYVSPYRAGGIQSAGVRGCGVWDPDYLHARRTDPMTSLLANLRDE